MSRMGERGPGFLTRVDRLEGDIGSACGGAWGAAAGSCAACTASAQISPTGSRADTWCRARPDWTKLRALQALFACTAAQEAVPETQSTRMVSKQWPRRGCEESRLCLACRPAVLVDA